MIAWGRAIYDLGFGVAMMSVAFDVGKISRQVRRSVAKRPRIAAVLTPMVLRTTGAVLGVIGIAVGTVRLIHAYGV